MRAIKRYLFGVISEMKKVRWAKPIELLSAFLTVVIFGAFFALLLYGFDFLVIQMLKAIKFMA